MNIVAFGGAVYAASYTHVALDSETGAFQWSANHGAAIRCIAVDSANNVYIGGDSSNNYTHRKYNSAGALQWSANHGATVECIAIDDNGNVYIGGSVSGVYTHRKYNSAGALQWSANHGRTVYGIDVDSSGNVYICGSRSSNLTHRKYDSSGNLIWSQDHGVTLLGIATTRSGDCYIVGRISSGINIRKINSDGDVVWSGGDATDELSYVDLIPTGGVITGSTLIASPNAYQYSSSGTLIWSGLSVSNVQNLCVDTASNLWLVGGDNTYKLRRYDINHNLSFNTNAYFSSQSWPTEVAVYQRNPWSKESTVSLTASATLTQKELATVPVLAVTATAVLTDKLSDFSLIDLIGTHLLRSDRWNKYSMLYIGLLTSIDPVVEVSDSNYQRVAIAVSDTNFVNAGSGWKNKISIQFQKLLANHTIVGYAIYHSPTRNAPRKIRAFTGNVNYTALSTGVVFPIDGLTITIN